MRQKLIIDADPGIGDALAIALALSDPNLDVVALTATSGVISGEQATRNLQVIVETLDPPKWPRLGASHTPTPVSTFDSLGNRTRPVDLHGPAGLGGLETSLSSLQHLKDSVKLLTDLVREFPEDITLLTLGPLTNVQLAVERMPEFLSQLKNLICLGGIWNGPGDVSPVADFNLHADPESARSILTAAATKTLLPADVARRFVFTFDELNRLNFADAGKLGTLFESLIMSFLRAHHSCLGVERVPLSELVALAAVTNSQWFESEMRPVDVETQGELTRGMTVIDRRLRTQAVPNVEVLTSFTPSDLQHNLHRFFGLK